MKTFRQIINENKSDDHEDMAFRKGTDNVPKAMNGVAFSSWKAPNDWSKVEGQNHEIKEPVLKVDPSKKLGSGLIIHEPNSKRIWISKVANEFDGIKHTFPQGGVERGLHPQANAIKETHEETGIKARITGFAGDAVGKFRHTRFYHAIREGGHPLEHGWESEGVNLVHPDNLHKYLNNYTHRRFMKDVLGYHVPD